MYQEVSSPQILEISKTLVEVQGSVMSENVNSMIIALGLKTRLCLISLEKAD